MADEHTGLIFRLNDHGQGPDLIRQVFLELGWTEYDEEAQDEQDWNLWWRTSRFRNSDYDHLMSWQRLNHYPQSTAITKKDSLARNLKRMRGVYGPAVFNFSPIAFNLPNDYTKFVAEYSRLKEKNPNKGVYWICKPADMSRGRGIFIFQDLSELQYDCSAVAQQYLSNPLLISGYKFDLRLYVSVPSFHPLQVYIYEEGLVRFSTEKFDLSSLGNLYSHLTNTSINKYGPSYSADKERVGAGCKWTISQLRHYFHQANLDDQLLWQKIVNIILLTLTIQANQVPKMPNCFELYGFDVIIDENMKPWLLEVNFSPALSADCQTDIAVKKPMLRDLIQMLDFQEKDKQRGNVGERRQHSRSNDRLSTPPGRHSSLSQQSSSRSSSVGRLPSISVNKSLSVISSGSKSSDNTDGSDQEFMAVVPGCGLPSVQHPNLTRRYGVTSSSGHSSADSYISNEDLSARNRQNKSDAKSSDPYRKISDASSGKSSNTWNGGPYRKISNASSGKNSNDPYRKISDASSGRNSSTRKVSKTSNQSDSGISSCGGFSDYGENYSVVDDWSQHQIDLESEPPNGFRYDKKNVINEDRYSSNSPLTQLQGTQRHLQSEGKTLSGGTKHARHYTSPIVSAKKLPDYSQNSPRAIDFLRKSQPGKKQLSKSLNTEVIYHRKPPQKHSTFTSNHLPGNSTLLGRRASFGGFATKSNQRLAYVKPWQQSNAEYNRRQTRKEPPLKVGGFVLAFPFNEATRKCSLTNLDAKVVVQECQKLLKQRHEGQTSSSPATGKKWELSGLSRQNRPPVSKILWGPIKQTEQPTT